MRELWQHSLDPTLVGLQVLQALQRVPSFDAMIDPYEDFGEEEEAAELAEQDRLQEEAGFPVSFFGHLTEEEVTIKKEEHDEFGKELGQLWPEKK